MKRRLICAMLAMAAVGTPGDILGAGASLPVPLFARMFDETYRSWGLRVNYQAIGSGGGVRQVLARTVDFGASEAHLSDERAKANPDVVHLPAALSALAVAVNLPGMNAVQLDGDVVAGIFLGEIRRWNDPQIAALNPGRKLPNDWIVVLFRSDGSGSTALFTRWLSENSSVWRDSVGQGKAVRWPHGLGARGSDGVAGLLRQIPGAIGYLELSYARRKGLSIVALRNPSGNFVSPSMSGIAAAAEIEIPPDTRVSLTRTTHPDGYPLSGFSWILLHRQLDNGRRNLREARNIARLLWWMVHEGQKHAEPVYFVPLPRPVVERNRTILRSLRFGDAPAL